MKKNSRYGANYVPVTALSAKEALIAEAIAEGLSTKQIAFKFGNTEETIKSYLKRVRKKLQMRGLDGSSNVKLARIVWEGKHRGSSEPAVLSDDESKST